MIFAAAVTTTLAVVASVAAATGGYIPQIKQHKFASYDGTKLLGESFVPLGARGKLPLVIFPNSWGIPVDWSYTRAQSHLVQEGYLTFSYTTRGWGFTGGLVDTAGPLDMQDTHAVVDFCLKIFPNVDVDNIAFMGVSYGGGISMLAAANNTRIKTAVSLSGWTDFLQSVYWNNSPSLLFGNLLQVIVKLAGRPNPELAVLIKDLLSNEHRDTFLAFAAQRSLTTVQAQLEQRHVPLFLNNNMEDNLFHSGVILDWFKTYKGPKKLLLSQGTHAQQEGGYLLTGVINEVWTQAFKFLDYHLKNIESDVMRNTVEMQLQTGASDKHIPFSTWPPTAGYTGLEYKFRQQGSGRYGALVSVDTKVDELGQDAIVWSDKTKMSCGVPLLTSAVEPYVPFNINLKNTLYGSELVFMSEPLPQATRVCGTIHLEGITITSETPRFQIYGYAYDVASDTNAVLLGHTTATVWDNVTVGVPLELAPMDFRVTCYDVKQGHRLAVGFNMHNLLYGAASATFETLVHFTYETATVTFPVVNM